MSFLTDPLKSIFRKPTSPTDIIGTEYVIPYASFVNAFQLLNPTIFDIDTPSPDSPDLGIISCIYEMWESPVSDHIKDKERFKPTTYSYWSNDDTGCIISFLEYKYTEIEKGEKEWGTLMLASPQMIEGELNIVPHAVFSGFYHSIPNGQLVIFPREVACLGEDKDGPVFHSMTKVAEVVCALAYMDQVLLQMISGSKVDNMANMSVFNPENFKDTKAIVNSMFRRSYSDLEKQVGNYLNTREEAGSFTLPTP